jgi:hypothetical protein
MTWKLDHPDLMPRSISLRAYALLMFLAIAHDPVRLWDMSRFFGVPQSTLKRASWELREFGFITIEYTLQDDIHDFVWTLTQVGSTYFRNLAALALNNLGDQNVE